MFDSIADGLGQVINTFNPLQWYKEGQARDEARSVRAADMAETKRQFDMNYGQSERALQKGLQPSGGGTSVSLGQDSSYVSPHMGQSIGSATDRAAAKLNLQILEEQKKGLQLDNAKKGQDLTRHQPGQPVAGPTFMPGGSQSVRGSIVDNPLERTKSYPGIGHMEPGAINSLGYAMTDTGLMPIPSKDSKERLEDSPYEWAHFWKYGITPNWSSTGKPPKEVLQQMYPGALGWKWSGVEWQPYYKKFDPGDMLGPLPKYLRDYRVPKETKEYYRKKYGI